MKIQYAPGATPLDPDEISGLIPTHITNQSQLNEWEAANILKAEIWLFSGASLGDFLSIAFIKQAHKKMFDDTWAWAGEFRLTEKNIGVSPFKITANLNDLLEDVRYQIIHKSLPMDEIAYRFHHRLVVIHPFANGNGRHARMMADLLLTQAGQAKFTWGKDSLEKSGSTRKKYIDALRAADKLNYESLAKFVRS
jgi:Fic-DOC domain mobile mystery protein B